ncbi:MOSC domain-containing protein, partial [Thioclava sp. BHET1]
MSVSLAHIYRHPIKAHGREALASVVLSENACLPWDRHWAVTHDRTKFDPSQPQWVTCANFMRGVKLPLLMAITARFDETTGILVLSHPAQPDLSFRPADPADEPRFLDWIAPLNLPDHPEAQGLVHAPGVAMTDTDFPSISILNLASNADLGQRMETVLSPDRWRGNLWLDGLAPWEECSWVGREIQIGETVLKVQEVITRCKATTVNPETGIRDA